MFVLLVFTTLFALCVTGLYLHYYQQARGLVRQFDAHPSTPTYDVAMTYYDHGSHSFWQETLIAWWLVVLVWLVISLVGLWPRELGLFGFGLWYILARAQALVEGRFAAEKQRLIAADPRVMTWQRSN